MLTTSYSSLGTPCAAITFSTISPLPTGTVDLLTTTIGWSMLRPICSATARTMLRSGDPSAPGGVPTAMNTTSLSRTPSAVDVLNLRKPSSMPCRMISASPGS